MLLVFYIYLIVFAYGQTGSGKTFTMGTTSTSSLVEEEYGIVPRSFKQIFDTINEKKKENPQSDFTVRASFLEIYGEELRDLLEPSDQQKDITIHENENGDMVISGCSEEEANTPDDLLDYLTRGSLSRITASTLMNETSSRSHAIFTLHIEQYLPRESNDNDQKDNDLGSETRTAKLHFVDLAGSERASRTQATGQRLREGININKGLLALGNVISVLGDPTKKGAY